MKFINMKYMYTPRVTYQNRSCCVKSITTAYHFSTLSHYNMADSTLAAYRATLRDRDPGKFDQLLKDLEPLQKRLEELDKEAEVLEEDRVKITTSVRAASKMSTGHNPSVEDNEVLKELSEHYSSFFDGGDSPGGERSMSTLNELMKLRSYIKDELKGNKKRIAAITARGEELKNEWQKNIESSISVPSVEKTESSGKSFSVEKGESSKRKSDSISDSDDSSVSSSKKSRPNPTTDLRDDLPELPYNPIDWDDF